jgi:hypothetical protein
VRNRKVEQKSRTEKEKKEEKGKRIGSLLSLAPVSPFRLSLPNPPFSPTIISLSMTQMEKRRNE